MIAIMAFGISGYATSDDVYADSFAALELVEQRLSMKVAVLVYGSRETWYVLRVCVYTAFGVAVVYCT